MPGTGVFTGGSASPSGQSFSGAFADVWQNFNGPFPGGGNGSTQMTWAGGGTNGTTAQFPGTSVQGVGFAASGDGGTAQDYRERRGAAGARYRRLRRRHRLDRSKQLRPVLGDQRLRP